MSSLPLRRVAVEALLIVGGSVIFAVGVDCFEIPYGLAAGGVTGLAQVISEVAARAGVTVPVGLQTIAMNALLMLLVVRTGNKGYMVRTVAGIIACGFFTDALVPFLPVVGSEEDLLLCALWGGVIVGVGLGLVFRAGGNTGGTDILAQILARRASMPLGTAIIIVDGAVIALSATVFSVEQALYAAVAMFISGKVIDAVVDGPRTSRAAYIITERYRDVEREILIGLDRGCTELSARGAWSGRERPVLFCVLSRSETVHLKEIVAGIDPDAIVFISEVHEAFGEGFRRIEQ